MDAPAKVCVVIPTYNERDNIAPVVDALESLRLPSLSVLFVDDSSPDGTGEEVKRAAAARPWVNLLLRTGKRGFSSACQEGLREATTKLGAEVLVSMDADLQHPVSAIPSLVEAVGKGADVAIASRYVRGGGVEGWSLSRRIVSRAANGYARFVLGLGVRDCTSGFKAYSRGAAQELSEARLRTKRFDYQIETLHLLRGRKMVEVPYTFVVRKSGQSKLRFWDLPRFFFAVARMSIFG